MKLLNSVFAIRLSKSETCPPLGISINWTEDCSSKSCVWEHRDPIGRANIIPYFLSNCFHIHETYTSSLKSVQLYGGNWLNLALVLTFSIACTFNHRPLKWFLMDHPWKNGSHYKGHSWMDGISSYHAWSGKNCD